MIVVLQEPTTSGAMSMGVGNGNPGAYDALSESRRQYWFYYDTLDIGCPNADTIGKKLDILNFFL